MRDSDDRFYLFVFAVVVFALAVVLYLVVAREAKGADEVVGRATFYDYHSGQAAAGPALRRGDWRGSTVTVRLAADPTKYVVVRLTDWCACFYKTPKERAIDLDINDFAALAPTKYGVIKVIIEQGDTSDGSHQSHSDPSPEADGSGLSSGPPDHRGGSRGGRPSGLACSQVG